MSLEDSTEVISHQTLYTSRSLARVALKNPYRPNYYNATYILSGYRNPYIDRDNL